MANAEARALAHNLAHPGDLRPFPHDWVPAAVFTEPQVATVGARLKDLAGRRDGLPRKNLKREPF